MGEFFKGCLTFIAGLLFIVGIGDLLGFWNLDSDKSSSDKVENFQGEYVLTSYYSQDPSAGSLGYKFIVKPDKTVKMKMQNENGEEYDSPWLPGYWSEASYILEGQTIYVITIGNDMFYLNLKDNYATMSEYNMKSKVPSLKITKVK